MHDLRIHNILHFCYNNIFVDTKDRFHSLYDRNRTACAGVTQTPPLRHKTTPMTTKIPFALKITPQPPNQSTLNNILQVTDNRSDLTCDW